MNWPTSPTGPEKIAQGSSYISPFANHSGSVSEYFRPRRLLYRLADVHSAIRYIRSLAALGEAGVRGKSPRCKKLFTGQAEKTDYSGNSGSQNHVVESGPGPQSKGRGESVAVESICVQDLAGREVSDREDFSFQSRLLRDCHRRRRNWLLLRQRSHDLGPAGDNRHRHGCHGRSQRLPHFRQSGMAGVQPAQSGCCDGLTRLLTPSQNLLLSAYLSHPFLLCKFTFSDMNKSRRVEVVD